MKKILISKIKKIKLVATDVDGVLTNGGMYYTVSGDSVKRFHVRDGMGVTLLRKVGISTIIITKEKNKIIKQWASKMKIAKLYDGITDKKLILKNVCKDFSVNSDEVAYIGDDINDLDLLDIVGFSATPRDGISKALKSVDYVCKNNGGNAAFREIADLIIEKKD